MKSDSVGLADFISSEIYLGLHPNLVWTLSSLSEDFITAGDFIFLSVLFTFWNFNGIIILDGYLLDKLEFDKGV